MRLLCATLALIVSGAAVPLAADKLDDSILSAPDRIWLRDTVNPSGIIGKTLPFFSYVTFQNGTLTDYYASVFPAILPVGCDALFECPNPISLGAIYTAPYKITTTGIILDKVTRADLTFDNRAGLESTFNFESFTGGQTAISLSLDHQALTRMHSGSVARYLPTTAESMDELMGMARLLSIPISEHSPCLIQGHIARKTKTNPDATDQSLMALAKLGAPLYRNAIRSVELTQNHTVFSLDLPQADQVEILGLQMMESAISMLLKDAAEGKTTAPNGGEADLMERLPAGLLKRFNDADLTALKAMVPLVPIAAPAFAKLGKHPVRSKDVDALLCHGL